MRAQHTHSAAAAAADIMGEEVSCGSCYACRIRIKTHLLSWSKLFYKELFTSDHAIQAVVDVFVVDIFLSKIDTFAIWVY